MLDKPITCGEAIIRLLEQYEVETVFGIPGIHTLELYRGLPDSPIRHILTRTEAGAGFMAEGYSRATGKPGVCLVITGPGVTNLATPLGEAFRESVPILAISSTNRTESLGKGWGEDHEIVDQTAVTSPLTALSATVITPEEIPLLLGQAFSIFASERPRPVHLSIPTDILGRAVNQHWERIKLPNKPSPNVDAVLDAADLLTRSKKPVIIVGGGASEATKLVDLAELLQSAVITSIAGKGIIPDTHSLSLGHTISRQPTLEYLKSADVVLAVGTELASSDSYVDELPIRGKLIRIDIDPRKINDHYPAEIGIVSDASEAIKLLLEALQKRIKKGSRSSPSKEISTIRKASLAPLRDIEHQHLRLLERVRNAMPKDSMLFGDMAQVVYSGCIAYPCNSPKEWQFVGGFGTLGSALPLAIGAKVGNPDRAIAVLVGDYGLMFTMQELMVAVEWKLSLPIIVWNNDGLGEIRDAMDAVNIKRNAVDTLSPDFESLARAFGCNSTTPTTLSEVERDIKAALVADLPTVIVVREGARYLTANEP